MNDKIKNEEKRIAVIIPCFNEELSIREVILEISQSIPSAKIYVFDNNSTDLTAKVAATAGATVTSVKKQGKGHVVRRMFADIEADIYLLVDGDATYDLSSANLFVNTLIELKLDMLVGFRIENKYDKLTYRAGHRLGNRFLTKFVKFIFGGDFSDMLSGYRVFSRRYVKSFPISAQGFEIETELTIHALELNMPFIELPVNYRSRPKGSLSKLNTYSDGIRILNTILKLIVSERPFAFFTILSILLILIALIFLLPIIITYIDTGLVPRFPTVILSTGMMICGALSFLCGIILHLITVSRKEMKRLHYLGTPSN
jgi:glycosyltransferase involved in cell wall biosynthesis